MVVVSAGMSIALQTAREAAVAPLTAAAARLDRELGGVAPWRVVAGTASISLGLAWLYSLTRHRVPLPARLRSILFKWLRKLPAVQRQIETEMEKVRVSFQTEFESSLTGVVTLHSLPTAGLSQHEILDTTKLHLALGELDWAGGAMSGTVYNSSKELADLMSAVYGLAAWTNPLHPDAFPGLRKATLINIKIFFKQSHIFI